MKNILISIKPKWCKMIAIGAKTVEVRKTKPNIDTPFKCYIYCTKDKKYLFDDGKRLLNGKVIGEFVCIKIEQGHILWAKQHTKCYDELEEKTQLTYRQMFDYLGESGVGYFWHISDLVIYDTPKSLNEFYILKKCNSCKTSGYESSACIYDEDCKVPAIITRPPQSWCYLDE